MEENIPENQTCGSTARVNPSPGPRCRQKRPKSIVSMSEFTREEHRRNGTRTEFTVRNSALAMLAGRQFTRVPHAPPHCHLIFHASIVKAVNPKKSNFGAACRDPRAVANGAHRESRLAGRVDMREVLSGEAIRNFARGRKGG